MIYFLIPIFNEVENIPELRRSFDKLELDFENVFFVFSDDGSTDESISLLQSEFEHRNHHIIEVKSNGGPGQAFNNGFNYILQNSKSENDIVITIEADSTGDYNLINEMILLSKLRYDLILASVYAQGGGFSKTTFFRKFLSFFANMLFRSAFDVSVLTLSSFYRCYDMQLLRRLEKKYGKEIILEKGFICMLELLLKSIKENATIVELPMTLNSEKRIGKSKMKIFKTTRTYIAFLFKYKFRK